MDVFAKASQKENIMKMDSNVVIFGWCQKREAGNGAKDWNQQGVKPPLGDNAHDLLGHPRLIAASDRTRTPAGGAPCGGREAAPPPPSGGRGGPRRNGPGAEETFTYCIVFVFGSSLHLCTLLGRLSWKLQGFQLFQVLAPETLIWGSFGRAEKNISIFGFTAFGLATLNLVLSFCVFPQQLKALGAQPR